MNAATDLNQNELNSTRKNYRDFLMLCGEEYDKKGQQLIQQSHDFLLQEMEDQDTGIVGVITDYAFGLSTMVIRELGLDPLGVSAVLILPLIEKKPDLLPTVKKTLGSRTGSILSEFLKISELNTAGSSRHAENMRNLILSFSTDFRVILIKISERLYQLRKSSGKQGEKDIYAAMEARAIYSPLAHRLGLYTMMSEMDDIAMSILESDVYRSINRKLQASRAKREKLIEGFIAPLKEKLEDERLKCEILGRPKSISSIWRKMQKQHVDFEEVYDKFAIRIILESPPRKEKSDCWRAYSIVTDTYQPNPDRLRDWISVPKSNGYESLHTTVVIPGGEWVEVQIRTRRMNEIAEKGLAAHWKYKGIKGQAGIDEWLGKVREALEHADAEESANLIDDLKLSQFTREIFVFTPNGDLKKFPEDATVLDFAYDIHTDVGSSCTGARINGKNVPIRHRLSNGDKVEIIRSKNQKAKVDWLNFVVTSKAKTKIKQSLKEEKLREAEHGKEILRRRFKNWKIEYNDSNVRKVIQHFRYKDSIDLHYDIAMEKVDLLTIKDIFSEKTTPSESKAIPIEEEQVDKMLKSAVQQSSDVLIIDEKIANIDYKLAKCCNPIHGDNVFGFVTRTAGISIHRMNCPNANQLLTRYGYRVLRARWTQTSADTRFAVSILIMGQDDIGIVSNITDVISKDLQVNMRSISIDSKDGMFEGTITLFVKDTQHLEALIRKMKKVKGVANVRRID
ncbi:MAG: TGS domain-containing protein [Bacteroidales bacterium]|nr:TGS domain-containing protein [Bacteroidales bacterium]MDT8430899.1 TGS domain-containing protein [Bacteroidales bacterium]